MSVKIKRQEEMHS